MATYNRTRQYGDINKVKQTSNGLEASNSLGTIIPVELTEIERVALANDLIGHGPSLDFDGMIGGIRVPDNKLSAQLLRNGISARLRALNKYHQNKETQEEAELSRRALRIYNDMYNGANFESWEDAALSMMTGFGGWGKEHYLDMARNYTDEQIDLRVSDEGVKALAWYNKGHGKNYRSWFSVSIIIEDDVIRDYICLRTSPEALKGLETYNRKMKTSYTDWFGVDGGNGTSDFIVQKYIDMAHEAEKQDLANGLKAYNARWGMDYATWGEVLMTTDEWAHKSSMVKSWVKVAQAFAG